MKNNEMYLNINNEENYYGKEKSCNTQNTNDYFLNFPVKSLIFYNDKSYLTSNVKNIQINYLTGSITAIGQDQFGEFSLIGEFNKNSKNLNEISMKKLYDSYKIEIVANLNKNKFEGFWKNDLEFAYPGSNRVEIFLDL